MTTIYLDQAATSFPKAPGLGDAMKHYFDALSVNINRSTYKPCIDMANIVFSTRQLLCELFHFDLPSHVIFTPGITHSLNFIIKGYLHPGDHCLISGFEHNAVLRCLHQLDGCTYDSIPFDKKGDFCPDTLHKLIKPHTKLIVLTHASNVFGNILPIKTLSHIAQTYGIPVVLDTAQTAGHFPIDFYDLGLSALCFTGHKGLLGPTGIGGMLLTKDFAKALKPLIAGGTGSASHLLALPHHMPDRFESGTLNLAGIYGLYHALSYLNKLGLDTIYEKERHLRKFFLDGLLQYASIECIGDFPLDLRVNTISLHFKHKDNGEIGYLLESSFGILTRCGLHCSPIAHQTMGTYPHGTVRFSFNHTNTIEELQHALDALKTLY